MLETAVADGAHERWLEGKVLEASAVKARVGALWLARLEVGSCCLLGTLVVCGEHFILVLEPMT